ncbi:MAG: Sec-independent protein translocase protein TatB [Pseudomonadota bacterium]|jgi:sec-independent protein translocase protein TatB|nr:MAG: twin-arginine translocase subunit TatB [Pseudomonadota bacterium]
MFGLDFLELVVIFIVALVVLGPTRLPGVARKVGRWIGKARAMARDFRQQLESEVTLAELNRMTEETTRRAQQQAQAAATPAAGPEAGAPQQDGRAQDSDGAPAGSDPAAPQSGDDTYSHAHAYGEPPPPWNPGPDDAAGSSASAADPAVTGEDRHEPEPAEAGNDKTST